MASPFAGDYRPVGITCQCTHILRQHNPGNGTCTICSCQNFTEQRVRKTPCVNCSHSEEVHDLAQGYRCCNLGCNCPQYENFTDTEVTRELIATGPNPDYDEVQDLVHQLLSAIGLDPTSEGLRETPRRVAGYLREFTQQFDSERVLKDGFDNPEGATGGMVVQDPIPFRGCCEHHLLPFHGSAAIGYIPKKRIVGLSKLTRLVQGVGTRKPSTQEEISNTIADILDSHLQPVGVIVVTKAIHTCMAVRGVNAPNVETRVSAVRGAFRDVPSARAEFFDILRDK